MVSKHFKIEELVDKQVFEKRGQKAWELINPNLIIVLDRLKERFPDGSMTINNWLWNGNRTESGLRTSLSKNYSPTSQHSLGNAADIIFSKYTTEEVRQFIINNHNMFPEIKGIELDVSWLHIDTRNCDTLKMFNA